jgi:NitT/TauT family transport system substrate-binding protein
MTTMKLKRLHLVPVLAALTLAACGGGADAGEGDGTATLRVAVIPTVTKAPMYLGIEKGFFKEEGLEVKPEVVQNGAAVTAAVTSGSAELGSSALVPTVVAIAKGVPVQIVTTAASTSSPEKPVAPYGDAVLVVSRDSDIETVADLNGKTIAVNALQAGVELAVRGSVDRNGGDASTLKFVVVPFPEMAAALSRGQVDAIAPVDPFVESAVAAGHRALHHTFPYDPAQTEEFVNSVYFTSSRYAAENPETIERFQRAMERANAYAAEHPDEVRAQMPEYTGVSAEVAASIALPDYPSTRNDEAYQAEMDLMVKYGFIAKGPAPEQLYVNP